MVKIAYWIRREEFFVSPVIRNAVLAAAAAVAAFTVTPAAHADPAAPAGPQYPCQAGPFSYGDDTMGSNCKVNSDGTAKQISFADDKSTYNCEAITSLSPAPDGSIAVIGSECTKM
jgi:hypothetical protein